MMTDRPTTDARAGFEARLTSALAAYADGAPTAVDAMTLTALAAEGRTPSISRRAWIPSGGRWLVPALLSLLLLTLLAGALLVGAQLRSWQVPAGRSLVIEPTGSMGDVRAGLTATLLGDGRVLVTGGSNGSGRDVIGPIQVGRATAEVYDPTTRTFTQVGDMSSAREDHAAVLMADGRVLITGGQDGGYGGLLATAEIFDPISGTFAPTGSLVSARRDHAAVLLPDGRVAIIGGAGAVSRSSPWPPSGAAGSSVSPSVEIYDPSTGTFAAGPWQPALNRTGAGAVVDDQGVVLIAGGSGEHPAALFDSVAGVTTPIDATVVSQDGQDRWTPYRTGRPIRLTDGQVVIAAGRTPESWVLASFGQSRDRWRAVAELPGEPLLGPTVLADGRITFAVAIDGEACHPIQAYAFDPATGRLDGPDPVPSLGACTGWDGADLTALDDGSALIAGGNHPFGQAVADAWLITPADTSAPPPAP